MADVADQLIERAEGILRQCIAESAPGTQYQAFAERITRNYPYLIPTLLAHLALVTVRDNPGAFQSVTPPSTANSRSAAPAPSWGSPAAHAVEPKAQATTAPAASHEAEGLLSQGHRSDAIPTSQPIERLPAAAQPIRPVVNPPRVSVAALAASNRRLGQSILDTWNVNGKKFGDCLVSEVLETCNTRDRATALMRAVVKDLPTHCVVRAVMGDEEAEQRLTAAKATLPKPSVTIDAHTPKDYRRVS